MLLVDTYLARQPILDRHHRVWGYEILHRAGPSALRAEVVDGATATAEVLAGAFAHVDLSDFLGGRRGMVNLPRKLVVERAVMALPPDRIGVEILEDVPADPEVIDSLKDLRANGYVVALDDFEVDAGRNALLAYADLVKIDVVDTEPDGLIRSAGMLRRMGVTMVAEKVENDADYRRCVDLGFELFQGYYFARPELVVGRRMDQGRSVLMAVLAELHRPEVELADVVRAIELHAPLAYQAMRVLNSAATGLSRPIDSIREAVVLLGIKRVRELASLLVLAAHDHKPPELVSMALTRARMCERIAISAGLRDPASFFTVGLFSLLDVLTDQPIWEVVAGLPLSDEVKSALVDGAGDRGRALRIAVAYERADWDWLDDTGLAPRDISRIYLEAIDWAGEMYGRFRPT